MGVREGRESQDCDEGYTNINFSRENLPCFIAFTKDTFFALFEGCYVCPGLGVVPYYGLYRYVPL